MNLSSWLYTSSGLNCRSECKENNDCEGYKDSCGRMAIINKKFGSELVQYLNQPHECLGRVEDEVKQSAVCEKNRCELRVQSCAEEKTKRLNFVRKNYTADCVSDSDCSFVSLASDDCRLDFLVSSKSDLDKNKTTLDYLNFRVGRGCKSTFGKMCDKAKVNQFFVGKCLRLEKRIDYVNFLNLEGAALKPNFLSRTKPLVVGKIDEMTCSMSKDCQVVSGVCI